MIGTIENAMVARLKSASAHGLLGYTLKTVESYGGDFDNKDELAKIVPKLPAAFVAFIGSRPDGPDASLGNGRWRHRATFAVLVAAQNKRNEAASRHGAAGAVGTYQMARDAQALLANQSFGLDDLGYMEPGQLVPFPLVKVQIGALAAGISIVSAEFHVTYELTGLPDAKAADLPAGLDPQAGIPAALARAAGITDFTAVHADWDAPAPRPDGAPVHADHISLETAP